jgi:tetratricopeptide (TPR) repeat protein/transglutaminase-like putative cysteine protease
MSLKSSLAVLLLGSIALSTALAQVKTGEKPASASPDFTKEAYVVERLNTRLTAENDGTGSREVTAEVKMLAEAGVKAYAVLNFTYTSADEVVDVDYVRVRKPDGTVVKTPDYNIQDMPGEVTRSAPLYSDIHEKHIAVKGLSVGDVLEYSIRWRIVKPEVPGQFWNDYSFAKTAIVKDERLELNVPRDKFVKVVSPDYKPDVKDDGARRVYSWTQSNLIVKEKDPDEIPRRTLPNPDVQITTFANWEEIGNWYGSLQKEPLTVTPEIQAKAAALTKGLTTDDEKIHAIYNFVALKFHYIGLDFGIGRYQPHAAEDVLENGYGDCKDKHTLLASLLKAAGYEAWPVLIGTYRKLDPDVPSPAQFNHVITVVPRNGTYIWLDTTPEVAPYRLLLQMLRNKQALVVPTNQPPRLMTTPENPPQPQRQEFSMSGKLSSDGTFTGHAEQIYEGDFEVVVRAAFRQVPESQWKELMQRISHSLNFGGDVSEVKVTPPDDLDKPFQISYEYVRKNFGDWEHRRIISPLPPMGIESSKDAREKKPQEPYMLGAVGKVMYRSRVELPDGYSVVSPVPVHLVEPYAEYDSRTSVEDGVMTTTRTVTIKRSEVPLSEWEAFRKFGETMYDDEFNFMSVEGSGTLGAKKKTSEKAALTKDPIDIVRTDKLDAVAIDAAFHDGENALKWHDLRKAQELFEQVIANNPDYKGAHLNLGLAMAGQNDMPDAVEQFRKEEKISPENTRVYMVLAEYDLKIGKLDQAIEEGRKLLKVDPENRTAASTLASLLHHEGKDSEAVEVLEAAVKAAPDSSSLQWQLGRACIDAGQSDRAVAMFRKAVELSNDDPILLNNVSYKLADNNLNLDLARQWAEKAVTKLEAQGQGAEASSEAGLRATYQLWLTWDTLGWVYFQQGDYKRAESFVRATWLLGEDSVGAEHLGEIYEKEGKKQEAAQAYEFALAVSSMPKFNVGASVPEVANAQLKQANEITARYEKLMGKKPTTEIRRLPNGEWTQTPAEHLRHSREVILSNPAKLAGSAQFLVTFKPGKVVSAEFDTGDDGLDGLPEKLKAGHYPLEFPTDSAAVLVVRVHVQCHATQPCVAELDNPLPPAANAPVATR